VTAARASGTGLKAASLVLWVVLLGAVFANVEIQIEGAAGWAANLPTWRIDHSWLNLIWGGKTITGYHVWIFSFMALAFHLPLFLTGTFSWRLEARLLGAVMVFWIVEDFLWFILNPAFGWARFAPAFVPWHKHWIVGVPVDYVLSLAAGAALIGWSYGKRNKAEEPDRPRPGAFR
jgi:hypothetical protein